jgi:crotonobetainyl-CoA:carnitine CoA-transferase CaiB-like acyl-CoA transferase
VPYKGFKTSDGDIMLGGGNDRLFGILCERLGKPEWTKDTRFATNADRVKHRDELEHLIEEVTATKTTQQWLEILENSSMPYRCALTLVSIHKPSLTDAIFFITAPSTISKALLTTSMVSMDYMPQRLRSSQAVLRGKPIAALRFAGHQDCSCSNHRGTDTDRYPI